ncbi:MAG: type III pantothenate kinase, partial [Gammaproteobacteria bacterium]
MNTGKTLLLDAGNSRIKWGFLRQGIIEDTGSAAYSEYSLNDLVAAWGTSHKPARLVVSNVRGEEFAASLTACTLNAWKLSPDFITSAKNGFGVTNAYHDAEKLGADRWAALIAAHHLYSGGVCIVDCGTAITIDTLTAEGNHLGGLIMPGLTMMRRALGNQTSALPTVPEQLISELTPITGDTREAITQGVHYAAVAAVERVRADLVSRFEIQSWLITGGDAERLMPLL